MTAPTRKLTKKEQAELLRQKVDTVGRAGKPGEQIQNVISVGMLSEGWDAKTVTHIMGLRAFTSQLLCEQVVGRGLRRTSLRRRPGDGPVRAGVREIFGVPFTFLPHEGGDGPPPPPPKPKTRIEPVPEQEGLRDRWPNVVRIDHDLSARAGARPAQVKPLALDAHETIQLAELAPIIEGKPDVDAASTEIDLNELGRRNSGCRRSSSKRPREVYDQMKPGWKGSREYLLPSSSALVEQIHRSDRIAIQPPLFDQDDCGAGSSSRST